MFRRSVSSLAVFAALVAATLAFARSAQRIVPGQKLFAELGRYDDVTVLLDVVAGTPLTVTATSYRGTTLRLDLALADPDGVAIDVGAAKRTNAKGTSVSVRKWRPSRTGTHRLTVASINGTQGGFDLATSGAAVKSLSGTGTIGAADSFVDLPFDALPGDRVTCVVKPARKSALKPVLDRLVDASGGETVIGAPKQRAPLPVAGFGTSRFVVTGADGTTGDFTWSLRFVRAKAPKGALDARTLDATGVVTGEVVVEGQSTRPADVRAAKAPRRRRAPEVRAGEVVLAIPSARSLAEAQAVASAAIPGADCTVVAGLSATGPWLVRVEHLAAEGRGERTKSATRAVALSASGHAAVEWTTPNTVVRSCLVPRDPLYEQQAHLRMIGMPKAWTWTTGDESVVVAVLDTGRVNHTDLNQQWIGGYDFVSHIVSSEDGNGWDADATDASYDLHGTHVGGIVGAKANNGMGVAGVCWKSRIVPVRVLGKDGGALFDVAAGLRWAIGLDVPGAPANPVPARVVNMSLGTPWDDRLLRETVEEITRLRPDVVLVAAAGNEGSPYPFYPAAYPGVIPVYALDQNFTWASYSNWGDWISVGAPGGDAPRGQPGILSTYLDMSTGKPSYAELSGTSMASPQVAGVVALMLAIDPTLTAAEVKEILEKTALDLGPPGFDVDYGWGAIDAPAALEYVATPWAPPNAVDVTPASLSFDGVENESEIYVRTKSATPVTIPSIAVTASPPGDWLTVSADAQATPATLTVTVDPDLAAGSYSGNVRITTSVGVVDVPVRAIRYPRPALTFVRVAAVGLDGRVVAETTTSASKQWAYTLKDLPLGRYRIQAFADQNSNLLLDRVDEWEGLWPLRTKPGTIDVTADALDAEDVHVPLERYDARFAHVGAGAGPVTGAVAVRGTDARTGAAVTAANVHVGSGAPLSLTDGRGRAVLSTGAGAQVVTLVAPGYATTTRAGSNGQYQGLALEPLAPAAKTSVTVTVRGLTAQDVDVWVQVGDARGHAVHDGVNAPSIPLAYTSSDLPVPVSAVTFDSTGTAMRRVLTELEAPEGAVDVSVTALPPSGSQARYVTPTAPAANFAVSGATIRSTTWLRWNDAQWVAVGDSPLAFGQNRPGWFADPGRPTPAVPMKIDVVARDPSGRVSSHTYYGTTDSVQSNPRNIQMTSPPALLSPANGSSGVSTGPQLTWSAVAGIGLHRIVVEEVGAEWRWVTWAGGTTTQVPLPQMPSGGLRPATTYRWSVESWVFGGTAFDASAYREERLDVEPTARTHSGWATFTTAAP